MNKLLIVAVLMAVFPIMQIFANEKAEVLPEENNIETPDSSMEEELNEIRLREIKERRQEKRALKKTPEYELLKSSFIIFGAITFSIFSVPATALLIGYGYHVIPYLTPLLRGFIGFNVTSPAFWTYGIPCFILFLLANIPILLGLTSVGVGIGLSAAYGKYYKKHNIDTLDENNFKKAASRLSKTFRIIAITGGIFGTLFIPMVAGGIGMLCVGDYDLLQPGVALTVLGTIISSLGFSFMSGALGAMAWLKKQTNRFSVDIGVASDNTGELACDKKCNAWELPNSIALSVTVRL